MIIHQNVWTVILLVLEEKVQWHWHWSLKVFSAFSVAPINCDIIFVGATFDFCSSVRAKVSWSPWSFMWPTEGSLQPHLPALCDRLLCFSLFWRCFHSFLASSDDFSLSQLLSSANTGGENGEDKLLQPALARKIKALSFTLLNVTKSRQPRISSNSR